jgi:hypothetical protein
MAHRNLAILVLFALLALAVSSARVEKGWITLETGSGENVESYKVELYSQLKQEIVLAQSSRLQITAKVFQRLRRLYFHLMASFLSLYPLGYDMLSGKILPNQFWQNGTVIVSPLLQSLISVIPSTSVTCLVNIDLK